MYVHIYKHANMAASHGCNPTNASVRSPMRRREKKRILLRILYICLLRAVYHSSTT